MRLPSCICWFCLYPIEIKTNFCFEQRLKTKGLRLYYETLASSDNAPLLFSLLTNLSFHKWLSLDIRLLWHPLVSQNPYSFAEITKRTGVRTNLSLYCDSYSMWFPGQNFRGICTLLYYLYKNETILFAKSMEQYAVHQKHFFLGFVLNMVFVFNRNYQLLTFDLIMYRNQLM